METLYSYKSPNTYRELAKTLLIKNTQSVNFLIWLVNEKKRKKLTGDWLASGNDSETAARLRPLMIQ